MTAPEQAPSGAQVVQLPVSASATGATDEADGERTRKQAKRREEKDYWSSDESGGSDAESQRLAGNFFYKRKRFEKAIDHFTKAIEMPGGSENSKLYSNRAMCFNAREEYRKAAADGALAVQKDAFNAKGYHNALRAHFALQEWQKCLELSDKGFQALVADVEGKNSKPADTTKQELDKVLRDWRKKAEHEIQKQMKKTIKSDTAVKLAEQNPHNAAKRRHLDEGKALYQKGDVMGAISKFEAVLLENNKPIIAPTQEQSPEIKSTSSTTGRAATSSSAVADLVDQPDESSPAGGATCTAETPTKRDVFEVTSEEGEENKEPSGTSQAGDHAMGNKNLREFDVVDVTADLEAHEWMAKCFMRLRRPKEARDVFQAQLALKLRLKEETQKYRDDLANIYSNLGLACKQSGDVDSAITSMRNALNETTKGDEQNLTTSLCAQILQNLGQAYRAKGDPDQARDAYQRSLEIYMRLYGPDHGCVALSYLAMARLPAVEKKARVELYDKVLKILDTKSDPDRRQRLLRELPEVPSTEVLTNLVQTITAEKAKI
ncbi:unnamed protein product [Amoebophrya sp. A120]|nr:unnamed protein product [Amoebophrya sp. A120]|eukprot:GSA120T00001517001.1